MHSLISEFQEAYNTQDTFHRSNDAQEGGRTKYGFLDPLKKGEHFNLIVIYKSKYVSLPSQENYSIITWY